MKFEMIGGGGSCTQYSLYDYTNSPFGVTVMSIEIHHESELWWFVGQPKSLMNKVHMQALHEFLSTVLS